MMKKIFSKILSVLGIAAIIVGLVLPVVSVKAAFNNDPLDVKTLKVANSTTDAGTYNWATNVAADAGNDIALLVYYHNTAAITATNTKVRVNFPAASQTTQTISVNIWSDTDPAINDSVVLNISSAQTVTFLSGSTRWYPNQNSGTNQVLPSGQSGDEIISAGGLNIGNMASGWGAQGYVSLKARISNNTTPITNPNPGPVLAAPAVTTYAASGIGTNSATLNTIINPNSASTTAWFEYGTNYNSLAYTVGNQNLGAGSIALNMPLTLSNLSPNTTYYFRSVAQNSQGTVSGNVLLFTTLNQTSIFAPLVATNSATNISVNSAIFNAQVNPNNGSTTAWFEYGTSSTSLVYSTGTQSLGANSIYSNVSTSAFNLSPNTTYYFRSVAQNSQGTSYGNILSFVTSISVLTLAPSITTYSATSIGSGSASLNSAVNPNNVSTTTWFEYGTSSSSLIYTTSTQSAGSGNSLISIIFGVSNLSANTTYYFRAVASNSYGTTYGGTLSFSTSGTQTNSSAPSVTTNAATVITKNTANLNGTINPNGSSADVWFEYGTSSSNLSNSTTSQNINGSAYVPVTIGISGLSSNTTYYFRPVAKNYAGTTYGAVNNFVTSATVSGASLLMTTKSATVATTKSTAFVEVSQSIENLTSPNGNQTSNFSDIGDRLKYTITLKNTGGQSANNLKVNSQIPDTLKYLESDPVATYSSDSGTISWNVPTLKSGETTKLSFIVEVKGGLDTNINNQVKVYLPFADLNIFANSVATFISNQKPVALNFSVDKNEIRSGENLNYSLTIKNTNNYPIKDILLSVGLPQNVELTDFDFNLSSRNENSLIVDLGSVDAGQETTKKFTVKVGTAVKVNDILTTIAIVNYQDQSGNSQPVVSASVSSAVIGSANLAASIFGGIGSFSVIDWMTLIGLIVLILVATSVFRGFIKKFRHDSTQ